jgi:hypothetical protein
MNINLKRGLIIFRCGTILAIISMYMIGDVGSSLSFASNVEAPVIDNISCDTMEHFKMHVHAHLDIIVNGTAYPIPSDVGRIPGQCIYWVHTHDDSGIIHIESPENRNFTLGEFFDIWDKTFNNSQIFDNIVSEGDNSTLNVFVNGKKVSAESNYRNTAINAHDEITIVYGTLPESISPAYEFPQGMRSTVNGSVI